MNAILHRLGIGTKAAIDLWGIYHLFKYSVYVLLETKLAYRQQANNSRADCFAPYSHLTLSSFVPWNQSKNAKIPP